MSKMARSVANRVTKGDNGQVAESETVDIFALNLYVREVEGDEHDSFLYEHLPFRGVRVRPFGEFFNFINTQALLTFLDPLPSGLDSKGCGKGVQEDEDCRQRRL